MLKKVLGLFSKENKLLPEETSGISNQKPKQVKDPFGEILAMESMLESLGYKKGCWETKVLAREMCLIEKIADKYDFESWYSSDKVRHSMRAQIARELSLEAIPHNDDEIRIGFGGCRPRSTPQTDRKALLLLGLPASGKSSVAQSMSDTAGAFIIDSDFAKRKFPEIAFPNGAGWTHTESNRVVFKEEGGPYAACQGYGYNMIIPKIGHEAESILKLKNELEERHYDVSLGLVWLDPNKALKRAISRYQSSKRYIPLAVIEGYESKPLKVFQELIKNHEWESHVHLSSDVKKGEKYILKSQSGNCIWWPNTP
ncbi:zeta toxin family protein [Vibrio fluvialis]|nr:zeta toxin family protein [Vibrio fluvialis]MBY8248241.1 zeta toxin family protein [Vibrio fluvialis]MBY8281912.1 zeta toxin family protein [Vibrio fluvialis]